MDNYNIIHEQVPVAGLAFNKPDIRNLKTTTFVIPSDCHFRPDKIALKIYNDESLDYLLDLINNFSHIKEYYNKRRIKIILPSELNSKGIK